MGVRVSVHRDRQRHLLQGHEGFDGRDNLWFVMVGRSKVKANLACLQICHGCAEVRQPCVQITDTRSIVVFDGLYPELVERFLVNGSRSAEDGQLASLYEGAVDFEA